MSSGDRQDPRAMILIFIGAITVAAWRTVSSLDPDRVLSAAGSLAPVLLGALALASALAMQRLLATNRTLQTRREVAIVPADDFDPKTDAVLRFAAELAGTERSVLGWLDRRASAVRVRLTCDAEGRLLYLLSVPERSMKLLRGALGAYEGIELREVPEGLGEQLDRQELAAVRTAPSSSSPARAWSRWRAFRSTPTRYSPSPPPSRSWTRRRESRSASASTSSPPPAAAASACAGRCGGGHGASTGSVRACWSAWKATSAARADPIPTGCSSAGW